MWSPSNGPGSEAAVVEAFSAWLVEQGWECQKLPAHGNQPDIDARHPDGRRVIVEAKGFTREAGIDVDTAYGRLLRRMNGEPGTAHVLVVARSVVGFARRVPSEVRGMLGITLYTVDVKGNVELIDGTAL